MYGQDAEPLYAGMETTLRSYPLGEGARVVIRFGGPGGIAEEDHVMTLRAFSAG
jgi:hypothetical protein